VILAFEMTWPGPAHAPVNSSMIQTIALAYPDQPIRVFADPTHITELRRDPALTEHAQVEFVPIDIYRKLFGKTHIVSFGRLRLEFATLRRGLAGVPRDEPCLVFLLSATSTAIVAASLLTRLRRGRIGVQVTLHGNLNDLTGWRSRNPLARAFDLNAAMTARHPPAFRFLVLEPAIKDALAELVPQAVARTDALPHPINMSEIPPGQDHELRPPLRIGLVGQGTRAKGIDLFLDLARDFRARYGDAVAFDLVGRVPHGSDLAAFAPLAHEVTSDAVSRADFVERLAGLHYVFLALQEDYYRLSASGALIDALTRLKPVVASRLPIVERLFEEFGEIGYLCDDKAGFRAALESILGTMDAARYRRQQDALRQARDGRTPERLAVAYRAIMQRQFGGLLEAKPLGPPVPQGSRPVAAGPA
jgi:glycosyltransferase involved in cell wall biosynthesis